MNVEICKKNINALIEKFDGNVSLYFIDQYDNKIGFNENTVVESASCIKLFILIEYYNQILNNRKSREDNISYNKKNDYVENGSGILQFLENLTITSNNMAILMMIVTDNIATNKMIEYLGFNNINKTIKDLGFSKTELIARKLDFNTYNKVGRITAYEYARAFKMILNKEILRPDLCNEIIQILSNQTKHDMLIKYLSPKIIEEKGSKNGFIKYIASKSGGLGDEEETGITNCRNDGGIISTILGSYIISIFINNFSDHYFYDDNPATTLGAKISKILFESFIQNNNSTK